MKEGAIEACGRLPELKRKFGAGYSLIVEPINNKVDEMKQFADLLHVYLDSIEFDESTDLSDVRRKFFTTNHRN